MAAKLASWRPCPSAPEARARWEAEAIGLVSSEVIGLMYWRFTLGFTTAKMYKNVVELGIFAPFQELLRQRPSSFAESGDLRARHPRGAARGTGR